VLSPKVPVSPPSIIEIESSLVVDKGVQVAVLA